MVNLPAARRHHRSRIGYAFGLLALVGAATTLVLVVRYPALSATQLSAPVPAPEITVVEGSSPPDEPGYPGYPDEAGVDDAIGRPEVAAAESPADDDPAALAGAQHGNPGGTPGTTDAADISRSLFYSGLLGLAISLSGLGLIGTRRRMW